MNQITKIIKEREGGVEGILLETVERIVIDYANLSGRESANRAEFREEVTKHLKSHNKATILAVLEALGEEVGKMKKEKQATQGITIRTEIDDTLIDVYNQALSNIQALITLTKQEIIN